jgi:cysteine desulfurase
VSSGSACSSKSAKISEVLKAMSLPIDYIESAIRLSFCEKNTKEDIDYLLKTLKELVPVLSKFVRR